MLRQGIRSLATTALLLALASQAIAHRDEHNDAHSSDMHALPASHMDMPAATSDPTADWPMSYWSHSEHSSLLFAHIILMVTAWVIVLPLGVMLGIGKSRLALPAQFVFLLVNALGLLIGVVYDRNTPDLYKSNSHSPLGWTVTWIAGAWVLMGLINAYTADSKRDSLGHATHPMSVAAMAQYHRVQDLPSPGAGRWSRDSGQGTECNSDSLFSHSRSPSVQSESQPFPARCDHQDDDEEDEDDQVEKQGFLPGHAVDRFLSHTIGRFAPFRRSLQALRVVHILLERLILILGFVAIATGIVVVGGIARGNNKFNVLAHFIKGGIFLWYGVLTLGRWMGCFADFGWAWNAKPPTELVGRRAAAAPTSEFVESALIFTYGASNVFLEHLAAWGQAWTAQDLEHVSISIMFFGGGLLGMLIESKRIRLLLNSTILASKEFSNSTDESWNAPKHYRFSMNPIPGLVVLLLGIMMSSHHQHSMLSTMVHKQWGTMFVGAAFARAVTYIMLYLSPPTSYLPNRPPSELVTAFCLIAGGTTFMVSNKDTVAVLESYQLDAMFTFTVTMGLTCLIMAWQVVVTAIKGWAVQREHPQDVAYLHQAVQMPA